MDEREKMLIINKKYQDLVDPIKKYMRTERGVDSSFLKVKTTTTPIDTGIVGILLDTANIENSKKFVYNHTYTGITGVEGSTLSRHSGMFITAHLGIMFDDDIEFTVYPTDNSIFTISI